MKSDFASFDFVFWQIGNSHSCAVAKYFTWSIQARSQDLEKGGGYFDRVRKVQTTLTRIFIVLELVSHGLSETWDEIPRKFKGFFGSKSGGLQKKKKKRSSPKLGLIFRPISEIQTFDGGEGLFSYGRGLFSIFYKKSASKPPKTCDFAYFTSQWGGGLEPPLPPWLRYWIYLLLMYNFKLLNEWQ